MISMEQLYRLALAKPRKAQ